MLENLFRTCDGLLIRDCFGSHPYTLLIFFIIFTSQKRATFYMYMAAMESTEAQRKGIVVVFYNLDSPHATSVNSGLRAALPINFGSLHLCVNEISTYVTSCAAVCTLSTKHRVRYRVHFGTFLDVVWLFRFGSVWWLLGSHYW